MSKLAGWCKRSRGVPGVQSTRPAQIADWLRDHLAAGGVGVVVDAEHLCMSIRGVWIEEARTVTSTLYGLLHGRGGYSRVWRRRPRAVRVDGGFDLDNDD